MPRPPSDSELLRIYRDTIASLYAYVSRRTGGQRDLAEDVTQETWLRAVRAWHRTGIPDAPIAWLTTVARNLVVDQLRRAEPVPLDHISAADALTAEDEEQLGDSRELAAVVTRALSRIPKPEAQLLEAFHFERSRVAQLAERYGISERAIEGRLRRARERLRRELELTLGPTGGLA
jgi:RNA polymerase sigma-70 factor (ECF subfamily)